MFKCQSCGFTSEEGGEHCGLPMVEEAAAPAEAPAEAAPAPEAPAEGGGEEQPPTPM